MQRILYRQDHRDLKKEIMKVAKDFLIFHPGVIIQDFRTISRRNKNIQEEINHQILIKHH